MSNILKQCIAVCLAYFAANAITTSAQAPWVSYRDVPQALPQYNGISPSYSAPRYSQNYDYTPAPQPQREVRTVTIYKVGRNGELTKTQGKIEISGTGAYLKSVRNNGSWWETCGTVYAIRENDPMYQYFDYQVRSADGTLYLF